MATIYEEFADSFERRASGQGSGGCPTCWYGADSQMTDDDFKELLKEIDAFVKKNYARKAVGKAPQ